MMGTRACRGGIGCLMCGSDVYDIDDSDDEPFVAFAFVLPGACRSPLSFVCCSSSLRLSSSILPNPRNLFLSNLLCFFYVPGFSPTIPTYHTDKNHPLTYSV